MGTVQTVVKFGNRFKAGSKGIIGMAASGAGTDAIMRTIDGLVGSPVQRIFSFSIPVLGTIGPIDALNYLVHAGGLKISKNGLIAVAAAKVVSGSLSAIGPISLPGSRGLNLSEQSSTAAGQLGGPV